MRKEFNYKLLCVTLKNNACVSQTKMYPRYVKERYETSIV